MAEEHGLGDGAVCRDGFFSPVLSSWHRASAEVIFLYGRIKDDSLSG